MSRATRRNVTLQFGQADVVVPPIGTGEQELVLLTNFARVSTAGSRLSVQALDDATLVSVVDGVATIQAASPNGEVRGQVLRLGPGAQARVTKAGIVHDAR